MESIVDHVFTAVAVVLASLAAWFARKASKPTPQQNRERLAEEAIDYALAHPQPGISLERTALDAARLGDVKADGKRDFTDGQLIVSIRAGVARRAAKDISGVKAE